MNKVVNPACSRMKKELYLWNKRCLCVVGQSHVVREAVAVKRLLQNLPCFLVKRNGRCELLITTLDQPPISKMVSHVKHSMSQRQDREHGLDLVAVTLTSPAQKCCMLQERLKLHEVVVVVCTWKWYRRLIDFFAL